MSKTSTSEVRCDGCGTVIPLVFSGSQALQMTLKGQSVGHLKADFCNRACLAQWADANRVKDMWTSRAAE